MNEKHKASLLDINLLKTINDIKKFPSINDIVKTIFGDSFLTLSDKETAIMREILTVIVSIGFSDPLYSEVVIRLKAYKHIFKNKHEIDKEINSLCKKGFVTKKTVKITSGRETLVSSWGDVLSLNKKISKSEMDDIIRSLVVHGFPER